MLYFNILSAPASDNDLFFSELPTKHGRYTDEAEANRQAELLREQYPERDVVVTAWYSLA